MPLNTHYNGYNLKNNKKNVGKMCRNRNPQAFPGMQNGANHFGKKFGSSPNIK